LLKESYLYGGILLGIGCLALILVVFLYITRKDRSRRTDCLKNPSTLYCDCNLPWEV